MQYINIRWLNGVYCCAGATIFNRSPHARASLLRCHCIPCKLQKMHLHKFYFTALKGYMSGHYHILLDTLRDFSTVTSFSCGQGWKCTNVLFAVYLCASVCLIIMEHLIRYSKWATSFWWYSYSFYIWVLFFVFFFSFIFFFFSIHLVWETSWTISAFYCMCNRNEFIANPGPKRPDL